MIELLSANKDRMQISMIPNPAMKIDGQECQRPHNTSVISSTFESNSRCIRITNVMIKKNKQEARQRL
jgi:hypothetical protein